MKKRHVFLVAATACVMTASVALYVSKVINDSGENFSSFVSKYIFGNGSTSSYESEEKQMINYLSQNSESSSVQNLTGSPLFTSTGYDNLSSYSERLCYKLIKLKCSKISKEMHGTGLYSIEGITVPECKLSTTQIKKILYAIQNDNPDIFWISSTFSYGYSAGNTILKLNSVFSPQNQENAVQKLRSKISQIISKIPKNSSEYETELFLHDYIVNNCKYEKNSSNIQNNPNVFTCYGCIIEEKAVCEGFSKAMQLLMNTAGIKCRTVTGARESEAHMWNMVKINENWYHLDVTWDAAGEHQRYLYFNLTDEMIKKDHIINETLSSVIKFSEEKRYNFKLPVCNSTAENYFEKNAVKIDSLNSAAESLIVKKLVDCALSKKNFIHILISENSNFQKIKKQLLTEKPYKFFGCVNSANKSLASNKKISSKEASFSENSARGIISIKLKYS